MLDIFSKLTGIHRKRADSFLIAYAYLIAVAFITITLQLPLYASTLLFMLIPALYVGYKLHREGRFIIEAVVFSVPAIITVDLVGHISRSWDYWRSEIFNIFIGPYPLIGFFWGFSFWLAVVVFYEYFYDGSTAHKAPKRERYVAFAITTCAALFLFTYDNRSIPYFYAWVILMGSALNAFLIYRYKYKFWKSYLRGLGLLSSSLLYEYISLKSGHWIFEQGTNIAYLNFFGYGLPFEEILWFLVVQHYVILFHETFADNRRF